MAATKKFTITRNWFHNLDGVRAGFSHRELGAYAGFVIAPVLLQIHSGDNRRLTFFTNSLQLGASPLLFWSRSTAPALILL